MMFGPLGFAPLGDDGAGAADTSVIVPVTGAAATGQPSKP
jgi:hypothetical protein